ncbi:MAG: cytidine deaminase [Bdellovibrionota bacterium]
MKLDVLTKAKIERLITKAFDARKSSHSPYSTVKVGAAVLTAKGKIYQGCNIENASYGATVCAERVAIWKAVSEDAAVPLDVVCVATSEGEIWPPCGLCRQVMAEFCSPNTWVIAASSKTKFKVYLFAELLPDAFTPKFLKKR